MTQIYKSEVKNETLQQIPQKHKGSWESTINDHMLVSWIILKKDNFPINMQPTDWIMRNKKSD